MTIIRYISVSLLFVLIAIATIGGCKGDNKQTLFTGEGDNFVMLADGTKLLKESSTELISEVSEDASMITFDGTNSQINSLSVDDIIIIGITEKTPTGLLRKVTNVIKENGKIIIETSQATLVDAFESALIEFTKKFSMEDIQSVTNLREGVTLRQASNLQTLHGISIKVNDFLLEFDNVVFSQNGADIIIDGALVINLSTDFKLDLENQFLRFINTIDEEINIGVTAEKGFELVDEVFEVTRIPFTPICPLLLPPVCFFPFLTINIGIDGIVTSEITADVTQSAIFDLGLIFENGSWDLVYDAEPGFGFMLPTASTSANLKVFAGPELNLLLYGVAGPFAAIEGFLELNVEPSTQEMLAPTPFPGFLSDKDDACMNNLEISIGNSIFSNQVGEYDVDPLENPFSTNAVASIALTAGPQCFGEAELEASSFIGNNGFLLELFGGLQSRIGVVLEIFGFGLGEFVWPQELGEPILIFDTEFLGEDILHIIFECFPDSSFGGAICDEDFIVTQPNPSIAHFSGDKKTEFDVLLNTQDCFGDGLLGSDLCI